MYQIKNFLSEIRISKICRISVFNSNGEFCRMSIEENSNSVQYLSSLSDGLDKMEEKNFSRLLNYVIRTQKKTKFFLHFCGKIHTFFYRKHKRIFLKDLRTNMAMVPL